jgi:hypothetical protein
MDGSHFDTLVRDLRVSVSRRGLLGGLLGGTLGLAGLTHTDAKHHKHHHKKKRGGGSPPASPPVPPPASPPTPLAGPTCTDGVRNGSETDTDCGGPTCLPCATGRLCQRNTDCSTARCGDALGEGTTCRACTSDGVCGIDANGGCLCDPDTGACLTDPPGNLPPQQSCACPPRTVCKSSLDGFFCIPLCGG